MRKFTSRISKLSAAVAGLFGAAVASADVSDVVFSITATSSVGTATAVFTQAEGYWDADNEVYNWEMTQDVELRTSTGELVGTLVADAGGGRRTAIRVVTDPQINLGFAVQAGPAATTFEIDSALLSFPAIPGAVGLANGVYTVTDILPGGATLTGQGPDGGAYLAQYNGFVPSGSDFTEQILSVTAPSGLSNSAPFNDPGVGYRPVGATVSDMSVKAKFTLSAFDLASGTTNYEILPEPGTMLLLAPIGLALVRRRR